MAEVNPLNGRPFSSRYYDVLRVRQQLPVYEAKPRIQSLVRKYRSVLLVGETGSGKTTQVPQFVLEMQPQCAIACTQPRRVAAMSVSERVAEELDVALGEEVGYTISLKKAVKSNHQSARHYLLSGVLGGAN